MRAAPALVVVAVVFFAVVLLILVLPPPMRLRQPPPPRDRLLELEPEATTAVDDGFSNMTVVGEEEEFGGIQFVAIVYDESVEEVKAKVAAGIVVCVVSPLCLWKCYSYRRQMMKLAPKKSINLVCIYFQIDLLFLNSIKFKKTRREDEAPSAAENSSGLSVCHPPTSNFLN